MSAEGLHLEHSHNFGNGDVVGALRWGDERIWLDRVPQAAWSALEAAIAAAAELEAARPVVEAAAAWRKRIVDDPRFWADDEDFALIAAVDLYRSATSDPPSTTGEKP